jgi:hypothetical protein
VKRYPAEFVCQVPASGLDELRRCRTVTLDPPGSGMLDKHMLTAHMHRMLAMRPRQAVLLGGGETGKSRFYARGTAGERILLDPCRSSNP